MRKSDGLVLFSGLAASMTDSRGVVRMKDGIAAKLPVYKYVITDDDHQLLQKGLYAFQVWSDRWLLTFNINKCKIPFYGRDINYE